MPLGYSREDIGRVRSSANPPRSREELADELLLSDEPQRGQRGEEEQIEEEVGEGGEASTSPLSEEVRQRLSQIESMTNDNSLAARMLAMPEVRRAMELVSSGKKIKVVEEGSDSQTPTVEEEEPNWEDFADKPQELFKYTRKKLAGDVLSSLDKILTSKLQPLFEQVNLLSEKNKKGEIQQLEKQVGSAAKRFPDFMKFQKAMVALHEENPGLDVEELYHLARKRSGVAPLTRQTQTESERPSLTPARPPSKGPVGNGIGNGKGKDENLNGVNSRTLFRQALRNVVSRMDFASVSQDD